MSEKMELAERIFAHLQTLSDYDPSYGILIECDAALCASPAEGEAVEREALIDALWNFMAPGIRQMDGDREVYGQAVDLIVSRSRAAVSPPQREEIAKLPDWQQRQLARLIEELSKWRSADHEDRFTLGRSEIICLLDAIIALYPAGGGREADSLSGEKGKPE